jgi:GDPmannose 4,6-dehydratase
VKRVVVVGSAGQDGRLLRDRLLSEGCEVIGIARSGSEFNILERTEVFEFLRRSQPAEIYYLAAFHHSSQDKATLDSLALFQKSFEVHVAGLLNVLEAIRETSRATRLFYAASSHIFGDGVGPFQDEQTPLNPTSIYGITKAAGVHCCGFYRAEYGVFASAGILYNHESSYREEKFVSQKIIRGALRIRRGEQTKLILGDLSARIDWGFAPDFVDAMIRILALDRPENFVIATGETHSVLEFVQIVFGLLDLDWEKHVEEDRRLLGRTRLPMAGNASLLRARTGWRPSVTFPEMVSTLLAVEQNGP